MAARAFITAIGLADRWDQFPQLDADDDAEDGEALLNLEKILHPHAGETNWSVPLWARPGDVIFFYCTANWPMRLKRLHRAIDEELIGEDSPQVVERAKALLERATELSRRYGGSVVSAGVVTGDPYYAPAESDDVPFRDAHFANVESVTQGKAVASKALRDLHVRIRRAATTTPLNGGTARALLEKLFGGSPPKPFADIEFWTDTCMRKYAGDWRRLVASDDFRPRNEEEVRALFVDPLVKLLAGPDGQVWRECRTIVKTRSAGIADYVLDLGGGRHLVVEAKLRATNLSAALDQAKRYLAARRATPQVGEGQGKEFRVAPVGKALLVDSLGAYLAGEEAETSGEPNWPTAWFARTEPSAIRKEILLGLGANVA